MPGFNDRLKSSGVEIISIAATLCSLPVFLYGAAIFLFQIVHWLQYGVWVDIAVIELFRDYISFSHSFFEDPLFAVPGIFKGSWPWIIYPTSWFGLHKAIYSFLEFLPLSWAVVALGCLIVWVAIKTNMLLRG